MKEKFQNRAAEIIANANYDITSADVLDSLGWETLEERFNRHKSVLMYKILNNQTAPNLKELFTRVNEPQANCNLPKPKRNFIKKSTLENSGTVSQ